MPATKSCPVAVKASRDLTHLSQSAIIVDHKGVNESEKNEEEIRKAFESFADSDKKGNYPTQGGPVLKPNRTSGQPQMRIFRSEWSCDSCERCSMINRTIPPQESLESTAYSSSSTSLPGFWALAAFHHFPILLGTALLAYGLGLRHAVDDAAKEIGGFIGTLVSAAFLFAIAVVNLIILKSVYSAFTRARLGGMAEAVEVVTACARLKGVAPAPA